MTSANRSFGSQPVLRNIAIYAVLLVGLVVTLAPFILSLNTALKTPRQFASTSALSWPDPVTGENFVSLFQNWGFVSPLAVTVQMVLVILVGQLFFSIIAAYAFARMSFPGRDTIFWGFLATIMVPAIVTTIPLYVMFAGIGLNNTFWALVLPYLFGSPYAIFLLREYFRAIPSEITDAAKVDGASDWRIIWQIAVPMSRPIIATLIIITVVSHWNSFLWPLAITTGKTWQTLTVATAGLQSEHNGNWTLVLAATTMAIAPLLIIFAIFQRRIVDSLAITGVR